jgi:hypothetical protein
MTSSFAFARGAKANDLDRASMCPLHPDSLEHMQAGEMWYSTIVSYVPVEPVPAFRKDKRKT